MTLTSLLVAAAAARPDDEGLVGTNARYTWSELERASAAVASCLVESGIRRGDRVAVAFLKDATSYIAVHGVLRAGAVVVPIDPLAPALHARDVLENADVSGLLGDSRTITQIDPSTLPTVDLRCTIVAGSVDATGVHIWDDVVREAPTWEAPNVSPDDWAYIIYTSGSSGPSKGILHTHRSAMAYAERAVESHELSAQDRVAGISPFHFDMSTLELYAAPLARAVVVVMGEGHIRFPASFTARSQDEAVTVWYSVPSLFRQLGERGALDQRDLSSLRLLMYGGEPYPVGALTELMRALPHTRIKNIYGPAEVNECTNYYVDEFPTTEVAIPIGRPWAGVELKVVSEDGALAPAGRPGELWVSAPTVMEGYWNLPDRTASSLHQRDGENAWYATGDIVSEDDGLFWFHGRRDHQVKVRGVRLELEAIESVLADAQDVVHAVAATLGDGESRYVSAAVALRDGVTLDAKAVRQWCIERLPPIAVPREIVQRADLPRTATGKIDGRRVREELAELFETERAGS